MNVDDLMTHEPYVCRADETLDAVAAIMWDHDCGVVPVVTPQGHLVGMITDRDICMATYTQGARPSEIAVRQVMSTDLVVCMVGDDPVECIESMRQHRVRRLPVVDEESHVVGLVSINDLVRAVEAGNGQAPVPAEEVVSVLAEIGRRRETVVDPS